MWTGVKIEDVLTSIYGNFYSKADIAIIKDEVIPTRAEIVRLVNKARKIGDEMVAIDLEDRFDAVLFAPREDKAVRKPIPSRAEMEAHYAEIMDAAYQRLLNHEED